MPDFIIKNICFGVPNTLTMYILSEYTINERKPYNECNS
jgi:hypothetical protein